MAEQRTKSRPTRPAGAAGRKRSAPASATPKRARPAPQTGPKRATGASTSLVGGRSLADPHDGDGQVVLRGLVWAGLVAGAVALGPWPLAVVLGGLAAWAAWDLASASSSTALPADRTLAAVVAGLLPPLAWFDPAAAGALLVVGVAGSTALAWRLRPAGAPLFAAAGANVAPWFFVGLAAAGPMFTWRVELGAVVVLLAFVGIYDAGSHLVGVDAGSSWEGPAAGIVGVGVVAFAAAAFGIPPFDPSGAASFALVAAATLPFGPVVASLLLPKGATSAAVRRIDSLLVLGPIWPVLVGLAAV